MRKWLLVAILLAAICATAVFFDPHPKKDLDAARESFKSWAPTQYFGYRMSAEVKASTQYVGRLPPKTSQPD